MERQAEIEEKIDLSKFIMIDATHMSEFQKTTVEKLIRDGMLVGFYLTNPHFECWFAHNDYVAEVMDACEADKSARAQRVLDEVRLQEEAKRQRAERLVRMETMRETVKKVFNLLHPPRDESKLAALAEVAEGIHLVSKYRKFKSKEVSGVGGHKLGVWIKTPSGKKVNLDSFQEQTSYQLSRRVKIWNADVPVFPSASGFQVTVTYYDNRSYTETF